MPSDRTTTAAYLAEQLGVSEGDIVAVLEDTAPAEAIPDDLAEEIPLVLDPHGERTAPPESYWPGEPRLDDGEKSTFRSPTREPGPYPPL